MLYNELDKLVSKYGIDAVIAELARYCNDRGWKVMFRRLNKIYEWLKS